MYAQTQAAILDVCHYSPQWQNKSDQSKNDKRRTGVMLSLGTHDTTVNKTHSLAFLKTQIFLLIPTSQEENGQVTRVNITEAST